ncbi:pyruvate formate-lyase-activating protein [Iodobacter fluviatilis]|uniref:Pyruvate formate-lyase-activating enzyme n=1 Tax=Iodobacter fluviatilis TaxID=537 RepID=A0A377Q8N5_9NEIS|nr:pyruvate formate-lyase-activating protein [Iodobacter fluviatilis]TCU82399.1 pyruvate formate lyase activating enzyme [Iodobacter fluviatilis]STQ91624.1 Pyruvate formate-lyase 1-activating enzyme [Iodobacter fluviatilis]
MKPSKPLGEIIPISFDTEHHQQGFVHSIETGAAVDGPGMRFALFVSGCQFRCLYCHNPDTWKLHNGKSYTVEAVMTELSKYASFLRIAGGLTISGGEPLMQAHFVGEIFRRAKQDLKLHTALDTQGFLAAHLDDAWFDHVDLVLLDIKQSDPVKYEALTGKPLQPTLDFAERLQKMGKPVWVRYVLIPGISDDFADVEKLADYLKPMQNIERVEVLPFHKMGESKWAELGMKYELSDTPTPTPELVERVRDQFRQRGLFTC